MWQTPHTRLTQRSARRRNHLGLLACLLAALFAGVLIGRLTDDRPVADQVFLNNSAPPVAARASAPVKRSRAQSESRTGKHTPVPRPRGTKAAAATPTRSPQGLVDGETTDDPTQTHGRTGSSARTMAAQVIRLTNAARARRGCAPLRMDARLTRSALIHSREMATSGMFTHESPDGSSPWRRMERAGYRSGAAENIGRGYTSAREAVKGWLASKDHRRNILHCGYQAIGVGVADGSGGPYWTQDFGYS